MDIRKFFGGTATKRVTNSESSTSTKATKAPKNANGEAAKKRGETKSIAKSNKRSSVDQLEDVNDEKERDSDFESPIPRRKRRQSRKAAQIHSETDESSGEDPVPKKKLKNGANSKKCDAPKFVSQPAVIAKEKSMIEGAQKSSESSSETFTKIRTKHTKIEEHPDKMPKHEQKPISTIILRRSPRKLDTKPLECPKKYLENKTLDLEVNCSNERRSVPISTNSNSKSPTKQITVNEGIIKKSNSSEEKSMEKSFKTEAIKTKSDKKVTEGKPVTSSDKKAANDSFLKRNKESSTVSKISVDSAKDLPKKLTFISKEDLMWVDKYKPSSLKQIIGQQGDRSNAKKLANWLTNWYANSSKKPFYNKWGNSDDPAGFKAALLSGPPGIGKTTTAHLTCKELGWDFIELNASDTRSKRSLEEEVATLLDNQTLSNFFCDKTSTDQRSKKPCTVKQHVLIMDEVDGMAGNEDRGGIQELILLIKKSHIPIICICNDRSSPKMRSLVNYCYDLRFYKPRVEQIKAALLSICFKENIKVPSDVLNSIIVAANQDIRQVLHYLSLYVNKQSSVALQQNATPALKDVRLGPFDAIKKVFTAGSEYDEMSFRDKSDLFFADYSLMPLFTFENYIRVNPAKARNNEREKLVLASKTASAMAFGDLIDKQIRHQMKWSLLPLQAAFSTVIPSAYMNGSMPPLSTFPAILGKISAINRKERLLQELTYHMSLKLSSTRSSVNLDYLEPLREMLTKPLIEKGSEGVQPVTDLLFEYNLRKDDFDAILELSLWPGQVDPMTKIDAKTKTALTKACNKTNEMLPYSLENIKKGKKSTAKLDDGDPSVEGEGEGDGEDQEEADSLESDAMIKAKKFTKKGNETDEKKTKPTKKDSRKTTADKANTKKSDGPTKRNKR